MTKIVFVINAFENDAPNNLILRIAESLQRTNFAQCCIVALRATRIRQYGSETLSKFHCITLPTGTRSSTITVASRLKAIIANEAPDIVHATLSRPSMITGICSLSSHQYKLIWTQNGIHEWAEHRFLPPFITRFALLCLSKNVDSLVAVSHGLERQLADAGFSTLKLTAIPNGIDMSRFRPIDADKKQQIREQFGYGKSDILIGTAGNLRSVKGHDLLMRAFANLTCPETKLIIWGTGPEEQRLRELSHNLHIVERVCFMGYEPALESHLGMLDLYVQPSRSEAFGLSVAEAIASGLPVIVNDTPGMAEFACEEFGCVKTDASNITLFAQTISSMLSTLTGVCASQKQKFVETYDLSVMTDKYRLLYEKLLADKAKV